MSTSSRTHEALRSDEAISAYGRARSTVDGTPLSPDELTSPPERFVARCRVRSRDNSLNPATAMGAQ